jgi:nucleoside-diphosphate-sugar epimerase
VTTPVLILGCGFTGTRVARRLLADGRTVIATARDPAGLEPLGREGARVLGLDATRQGSIDALCEALPERVRVVHSIPPKGTTPALLAALAPRAERLVYISSTGVYGATPEVDETSRPAPVTPMQTARREAEVEVLGCGVPALVLRAPAIYGPGRGVHASMRAGRFELVGAGDNFVSRIHAEDLAAHVVAGLFSDVVGAWPLGDARPATSAEVAAHCAELLGLPMPPSVSSEEVHETRRATRRVSGEAIRAKLGVTLRYPTYREGIAAALDEEAAGGAG